MTERVARAVKLGPFTGGLNNLGEMETLGDDELAEAINFELSQDGTLQSRPAIIPEEDAAVPPLVVLGIYIDALEVTSMVIVQEGKTWLYGVDSHLWTEIWQFAASGYCQYDNKVVLCASDRAGGYWEEGTFKTTAQMPIAENIVFYQERFWAHGARGTANATRVWFSKVNTITPATSIFDWGTSDFFTVDQGDGQWITGLLPTTNTVYIFRSGSTYRFDYPSSPLSGTLRKVSQTIGADNRWCFAAYENYHMVLSKGTLYQFQNSNFYQVNQRKLEFRPRTILAGLALTRRVSIFGHRAIIWHEGNTYVYNLVRTAWTRWESPTTEAASFWQLPPTSTNRNGAVALATTGSLEPGLQRLYRIEEDILEAQTGETISCLMRTKAYNFDDVASFKRLMYWVVEARTATGLTGVASPIAVSGSGTTWNEMSQHTWNEMSEGSWNNFFVGLPSVVDPVAFPISSPMIAAFKLVKQLRFLRIYFEVSLVVDGTSATSPARINAIVPMVRLKSGISRKVN